MEIFTKINDFIVSLIQNMGYYGVFLSCFLILIESIVPILPLGVFITINFLYYGHFLGFIISWIFTIAGCVLSYFLSDKILKHMVDTKLRSHPKVNKYFDKVDDLKFTNLVTLISIPFTPAFLVNIAAGVSKVPFKKFFWAIVIGKIFLVYFWGYIGTSLVESLTNPMALVKVIGLVIIAYGISLIVNKKFKLD